MNPRIKKAEYKSPHKLIITFLNGELKEFNLRPYLHYPVYEILSDEAFCSNVKVVAGTVTWNDEIDFDPDRLYEESQTLQEA